MPNVIIPPEGGSHVEENETRIEALEDGGVTLGLAARVDDLETWSDETTDYLEDQFAGIFNVLDYEAVGDGVTDDSAAITNAYEAAAAVIGTNQQYRKAVVQFPPGVTFRVMSTLPVYPQVHTEGNGARLLGPITGAGRITGATAVPTATDVSGQTAGGCFADVGALTDVVNWPSFSNIVLDNFRFGFVSKCYAWAHPHFDSVEHRNTDIGYFVYQGAQQWTIVDPLFGYDSHCVIAAGATCFAAGHSEASKDNYFCDGLRISARKQTLNTSANADVDDWFEDAILRPATASVTVAGSQTFSPTGTFRKVTGRAIYAPSRNRRNQYGWEVGPLNMYEAPRGAALMRYPIDAWFNDIAGENCFDDVTVNTGQDESMIVVGVADTACSGSFHNIDADNSAGSANYKGAVDIVNETATTQPQFVATQITGATDPRYFTILDQTRISGGGVSDQRVSFRGPRTSPAIIAESGAGILDLTTAYLKAAQANLDAVNDHENHEVRRQLFAGRLPIEGGAQTKAFLDISGASGLDTTGQIIKGTCRLYIERMDNGEIDFAQYLVNLSQRFAASTTLGANALAGATTITVASSGAANAFSPGTAILIDASEKALVKSVNGAVITLNQALVGAFSSGDTVTGAATIATITALTNAWVAVGIESNQFRITNSIDPVPIRFHALFEYPSPRF